ncbi:MAG: hypothetical protein AB7O52_08800 [Planctomycetota bacterium]
MNQNPGFAADANRPYAVSPRPTQRARAFVRPPLRVGFAAILMLSMSWLTLGSPVCADGLPSVKDALASEVHGEARLKKNRIQIAYDFRKENQALDFALDNGAMFGVGDMGPRTVLEHPKIEAGQLRLDQGKWARGLLPLVDIAEVSIWVQGVDGFSIRLRHGQSQVTVNFREYPSISFDAGIGWGDVRRVLNLVPTKSYRFDLVLKNGKAIGKIDGKPMLEAEIPATFGAVNELTFGPAFSGRPTSSARVTGVQVSGTISPNLPVIAANRGGAKADRPPIWEQSFTRKGEHITVVSPVSEQHATEWCDRLNTLTTSLLRDYPPSPPAPPPDAKEAPVDRKVPDFSYERLVYLFPEPQVMAAYCGSAAPIDQLENGTFVVLVDPAQDEADPGPNLTWRITSQMLAKLYPTVPLWWQLGNCSYYSVSYGHVRGLDGSNAHASNAKAARGHLDQGTEPRLSSLLSGWVWSDGQIYPTALSWAWVHFLRHANNGAHAGLLTQFHQALRAGLSAEQAGTAVFPTTLFNELYPQFESYLKDL